MNSTNDKMDNQSRKSSKRKRGLFTSLIEPLFFKMRYISFIAVFASLVSALVMFLIGLIELLSALGQLFSSNFTAKVINDCTVILIRSLDSFLFGLVLLIFSYGIYDLFIQEITKESMQGIKPDWLMFENISDLKHTLVEIIIIILIIDFFVMITRHLEDHIVSAWEFLIIPTGVLLLAIGMKIIHHDTTKQRE